MNRNLKIKQISVPEFDEESKETGNSIILEVVSIEKIKTRIPTSSGAEITTEELVFVCFENMEGQPKKLRIINTDSDLITVTKYENNGRKSTKHRCGGTRNTRTN